MRVFFVGHSTLLIEIGQTRILTDPVWSATCSPLLGCPPRRFSPPGLRFEELPPIDLVLVSHNHYDHLDKATIVRLGSNPRYIVPTGLAEWFRRRQCHRVTELKWWESIVLDDLTITATPSQHWSKRTLFDTNRSHWCSFAIRSTQQNIFFTGDSGYYEAFGRIGEELGPFTAAALPIGAYAPEWFMDEVHMSPEQAVRAFEDLKAGHFLAIHHSTFQLTDESPHEPMERLRREWLRCHYDRRRLWIPRAGDHIVL